MDVSGAYEQIRVKYPLIFPHSDLKQEQIESLEYMLNNEDTFCVLPTGYGKSTIYFLLPLIKEKVIFSSMNVTFNYTVLTFFFLSFIFLIGVGWKYM